MTIFKGSRYEYSLIDYVATKENESEKPIVFYSSIGYGLVSYYTHTYIQGERLDQISDMYYQTPERWWLIAEYNPEVSDFLNIEPGTLLRIPNV